MNWKLIFSLSLIGIAIAFAGVFGMPGSIEPYVWLVVFIFYAVVIVKSLEGKYFLHAFMVSAVNGVWIGIIHALFVPTYLANHPEMLEQYSKMPVAMPPAVAMLIFAPFFGALFGLVAGLFAVVASKIMKNET